MSGEKTTTAEKEQEATTVSKDPSENQEIRFRRRGALAEVILSRPNALNALTLKMIRHYTPYLPAWDANPAIRAVAIHGDGDKAFCAGGDVRTVWDAGKAGNDLTVRFFAEEYRLNREIRNLSKPYVALVDGVTMGGGIGLSVHGRYRIAGDKTVMAMPETGIGFFPDVGTTYVLSRLPGALGMYLGLTGARLGPADALYTGLATHYIPDGNALAIPDALVNLSAEEDTETKIEETLKAWGGDPGLAPLAEKRAVIDRCFGQPSVSAMMTALEKEGSPWAQETYELLQSRSPTSLKLTCAALQRAADQDFDICLQMEYRLSQRCMAGYDFYEGIRAVLVDKDKTPVWSPKTLEEVDDEVIEQYFYPLGDRELTFE